MNRKYLVLKIEVDEFQNVSYCQEHECLSYKEALSYLKEKPDRDNYIIQDIFN